MSDIFNKEKLSLELETLIKFVFDNPGCNLKFIVDIQNHVREKQVELDDYLLNSSGIVMCLLRAELLKEDVNFESFDLSESEGDEISFASVNDQVAYLEYLLEELIVDVGFFTQAAKNVLQELIRHVKFYDVLRLRVLLEEKRWKNQEVEKDFLSQIPDYSRYFVLDSVEQPTSFYIHWNDWVDFLHFLEKDSNYSWALEKPETYLMNSEFNIVQSKYVTTCALKHFSYRLIGQYINNSPVTISVQKKVANDSYLNI